MDTTNRDQSDRLSAIQRWLADYGTSFDNPPYYAELVKRIRSIERLGQSALSAEPVDGSAISLSTMTLTVQLDRCEAVIERLKHRENSGKKKRVEQFLYPSLSTAFLQRIIHFIVKVKNRLGLSDKTYSSTGLLHLCYLKAPPGLTAFISRFLPRIW